MTGSGEERAKSHEQVSRVVSEVDAGSDKVMDTCFLLEIWEFFRLHRASHADDGYWHAGDFGMWERDTSVRRLR
nr:hypothetical protein CFP56_09323 [Quercus suber]